MIGVVYAIVLGLLLTGCTSVVSVSKSGSTETDWRQADCLREANGADTPQRARRLYEVCLRANGWIVARVGPEWPDVPMNTSLEGVITWRPITS